MDLSTKSTFPRLFTFTLPGPTSFPCELVMISCTVPGLFYRYAMALCLGGKNMVLDVPGAFCLADLLHAFAWAGVQSSLVFFFSVLALVFP